MAASTVKSYFTQRQAQTGQPSLHLYALVDALLYARVPRAASLRRSDAAVALFDETPDASLADAGPWLIDFDRETEGVRHDLRRLADGPDGVAWLISAYPLAAFAQELRTRLDVRMPDGRTALLRFYDARLVADIATLFTFTQRLEFFVPTYDWLVEIDGQLARVHPNA